MIASIKERYKPTLKQKLSVFEMSVSTSVKDIDAIKIIADAIDSFDNTHHRDKYILIIGWIRGLDKEGYEDVKFELEAMKSDYGVDLLRRAMRRQ